MEHHFIDVKEGSAIQYVVVNERNNNMDQLDNLDTLPSGPAVYAICGSINGKPVNPRLVDETDNLAEAIRRHFDPAQTHPNRLFKEFMLSIKIKMLVYEPTPELSREERLSKKMRWENRYLPKCTEALNEIH